MELQIFKNEQFELNATENNGEILFKAEDVAKALGFTTVAKSGNVTVRWSRVNDYLGISSNPLNKDSLISEPMLYKLAFKANNNVAEKFTDWVAVEVLPTIRKHGAYMTDQVAYNITHDKQALADLLLMAGNQLKEKEAVIRSLEAEKSVLSVENLVMKPKADYFDELVDRNLLTSFRETAKQLKVKERKFIDFLLEKKYIYRNKKGKLMPFANKNDGLFEVKETINEKTQWSGTQTLITPKGRETFRLLFI